MDEAVRALIETLRAENLILREALEHYADYRNWQWDMDFRQAKEALDRVRE